MPLWTWTIQISLETLHSVIWICTLNLNCWNIYHSPIAYFWRIIPLFPTMAVPFHFTFLSAAAAAKLLSVQFSSVAQSSPFSATPWISASQASLSITNSQSLLKPMSIELVMPASHLTLWHPLLLLPPIPPSIGVFSNESTLRMRWPKYWSFSFSTSPSNEHPGLISFRMDWLDLLAVQGTLKSLL